jgi:hypothetical protein
MQLTDYFAKKSLEIIQGYIEYWNDGPEKEREIVMPTLERIKTDLEKLVS